MGPLQNRRKATAGFSADWMKHELCLATLSMRRHDQAARDYVRDIGSVVATHDMETEVDSGRAPGRCQDISFIHVQNIRLDLNVWKTRREPIRMAPVRRHAFAIEKAGSGQNKDAGTDRHQTRSTRVCHAEFPRQRLRRRFVRIPPSRNNDCARLPQGMKTRTTLYREAAHRPNRARLQRAD